MSVSIYQIQDFYCGALKDAINSEESVRPFMYSLFGVMSTPTKTDDDSRIYWSGSDPQKMNLIDKALLCLGMMIEILPAEMNVIPYTLEFVNEAVTSWSPHTRKAACLAITVIADSDRADKPCLQKLLPLVTMGITDRHTAVRNAALCALGQFHYNREINLQHHYDELLVPLLHCLRLLSEPLKLKTSPSKSYALPPPPPPTPYIGALFDTLVSLCSGEHDKMERGTFGSYISKVIEYLLLIVNASYDISIREKAAIAVKEIVRVSKKESVFYIHRFAKFLKTFIKIRPTDEQRNILVALLEIFEMMDRRLDHADFKPLAKKCFQLIMAGIKVFRDYSILKRVHRFLAKLMVLLDEEMDKNVSLRIIHVSKSELKPPSGENLQVSEGCEDGLYKTFFDDSVSFQPDPYSIASPPLHDQEGLQIFENEVLKCNKTSTKSTVSSDLDEIYIVDISDERSSDSQPMCASRNSSDISADGPNVALPNTKLESMKCEIPETMAENVNILPFNNSKSVETQPDLGGTETSSQMKGDARNNQSTSTIFSVFPKLLNDVTDVVSVKERDGNDKNAFVDAVVPVVSDAGDLDAGNLDAGDLDARQTKTGEKIESGDAEPTGADNYLRRSMSVSSVSSVCIIEHEEGTRRSPRVPKSYELPRRSRRCPSVSGSSVSIRNHSRRRSCRASRRHRRSPSGSPSSRSYWRRRSRNDGSSRSRWSSHLESRSRSRSPRRKSCNSRCRCSTSCKGRKQWSERDAIHRRVVYVNLNSNETTKSDLRRRFQKFGRINHISLYSSDGYGHIEFAHADDARLAVRHGSGDPDFPYNHLALDRGDFRPPCNYQDLDRHTISSDGKVNPQPRERSAFDKLLGKARKATSERKRKMLRAGATSH